MKLAVMQPYFFPYLGYFQLIFASDRFVAYDDVSFIKSGWINRNRILLDGEPRFFTVPLRGASSFVAIDRVGINEQNPRWRGRMLDTMRAAYRGARYRDAGVELLERVLASKCESIADLALASVYATLEYLGISRSIARSSRAYDNRHVKGQDRILDICRKERADVYVNAIGGVSLYQAEAFEAEGCDLKFLRSKLPEYSQGPRRFVPGLSMLDAIMHCSPAEVTAMLPEHDLLGRRDVEEVAAHA